MGEPSAEVGAAGLLGKAELAVALGWSRPKLDRHIARDAGFPVRETGGPGKEWRFHLGDVRAHLQGSAAARGSDDGGAATATMAPFTERRILGKRALASELGWSRPKLDRFIETHPNFPVHKRGDQSGGWEFDLVSVRAYLDGRPQEAVESDFTPGTSIAATQMEGPALPPAAPVLSEGEFAIAVRSLLPKGIPVIEETLLNRDGLTETQFRIVARMPSYLGGKLESAANFADGSRIVRNAINRSSKDIHDFVESELAKYPDQIPRALYLQMAMALYRMHGAIFDLGEFLLLQFRHLSAADRNAIWQWTDELRADTIEMFRQAAFRTINESV